MPFIGNTPDVNFTSFAKQDLTGVTGSPAKRGYTLSHAVANANEIEVFVNNVRQEPTESYTVNGTGLTMTGDVETSDDFYIIYLGKAIQTTVPPDGSVSTAKLANNISVSGNFGIAGKTNAPTSPTLGDMWFNSSSSFVSGIAPKAMAVYNGTSWSQMSNIFSATGGTITTYSSSGVNYNVHTFTSSGVFMPTTAVTVNYLVVAGGGSGGSNIAGGGGAGGFRTGTLDVLPQNYPITVGAGGAAGQTDGGGAQSGNNGGDSIFSTITSNGGGAGGPEFSGNGNGGGSGGGGSRNNGNAGSGTSGQGNNGGNGTNSGGGDNQGSGGGGGGAGAVGVAASNSAPGNGGAGLASSITGSSVTYAGGGGGGGYNTANSSGGSGGGGNGSGGGSAATAGEENTGSGGGAGGYSGNRPGKNGGSGIVIISYAT